jgi:hypothetical protein
MSGGDYDPCECIFNHEMAMRRLLSLLRSNQGNCVDNECFQDGLPGTVSSSDNGGSMMMMMMAWMVMAFVMYLLRPQSMRPRAADRKDGAGPSGHGGPPERRDDEPPAVM